MIHCPHPLRRLAQALLEADQAEEALPHFQACAQGVFAHDAAALSGLARCQAVAGQEAAAVASLRRLFGEDDVDRLETILRLQRDEFLPLRVIRQVIASPEGSGARRRKLPPALGTTEDEVTFGELVDAQAAGDFAASSAPITDSPPGRFSTTTC